MIPRSTTVLQTYREDKEQLIQISEEDPIANSLEIRKEQIDQAVDVRESS